MENSIKVYGAIKKKGSNEKRYFAIYTQKKYPKNRKYLHITKTFDEMFLTLRECGCTHDFERANGHTYFLCKNTEKIEELRSKTQKNPA